MSNIHNISTESLFLIRFLIDRAIDYYTSEKKWPEDDETVRRIRLAESEIQTEIDFRGKALEGQLSTIQFMGFSD